MSRQKIVFAMWSYCVTGVVVVRYAVECGEAFFGLEQVCPKHKPIKITGFCSRGIFMQYYSPRARDLAAKLS